MLSEDIEVNKIRKYLIKINLILLLMLFILVFLELSSPAYYIWKVGILWEKILKKPEKAVLRYKRLLQKYPDTKLAERAMQKINQLENKKKKK